MSVRLWIAPHQASADAEAVCFRESVRLLPGTTRFVQPDGSSRFTMDPAAARQFYAMWDRNRHATTDAMFENVVFDMSYVQGRIGIKTAPESSFPHISLFVGPRLPGSSMFKNPWDAVEPDQVRAAYLSSRHRRPVLTIFVEADAAADLRPRLVVAEPSSSEPTTTIKSRVRRRLSWYAA